MNLDQNVVECESEQQQWCGLTFVLSRARLGLYESAYSGKSFRLAK